MSKLITNRISLCSIVALSFLGLTANDCLAQGSDCIDNGTFNVCVEWSIGDNPVEGTDYDVEFHGTAAPDLDLLKGNDGWIVYCEEFSNPGTPADIGVFKTTGDNANYKIQIRNGAAAGFKNVGSASLVPGGGKSSSIQAAEGGLSVISGDLNGLTLTVGSPASGGVLDGLLVLGDLTGPLTVPTVKGDPNRIAGDATENADIEIGEIDNGSFEISGSLVCNEAGTVCPDITVTGKIYDGSLIVGEDVPSGSTIKIEELEEPNPQAGSVTEVKLSDGHQFAGTLDLPTGLANANTLINMAGLFSGVIDLHGGAVVGEIAVYDGTTTAEIKNGGVVSGDVYLGQNLTANENQYNGTATFASVTSTGEIATQVLIGAPVIRCPFGGVLTVTGQMAGLIEIAGSLLSGAEINLTGSLLGGSASGNIVIEDDCAGAVDVHRSVSGDICIGGDMSGSVTVRDALGNGTLTGGGRILIAGESSGPIKVGEKTGSLTLIQVVGGLATGSTIEINTTEGNFNAEGDIHIGGSTPVALPFDGCIRIYDDGAGNGGKLDGNIDVVACHSDEEILNICVDGSDNGNINLDQTGCSPANATWSCGTCPPTP